MPPRFIADLSTPCRPILAGVLAASILLVITIFAAKIAVPPVTVEDPAFACDRAGCCAHRSHILSSFLGEYIKKRMSHLLIRLVVEADLPLWKKATLENKKASKGHKWPLDALKHGYYTCCLIGS